MTVLSFPDPRGAPDARALPSNVEAEQAVLGACLINNAVAASLRLDPEHFSEEIHRRIWTVMTALLKDGNAVTPTVLKTYLGEHDLGGITVPQYLARLMAESSSPLLAATYGREIVDIAVRRQVIASVDEVRERAYDPPLGMSFADIIDFAEAGLMEIRLRNAAATSTRITAEDAATDLFADIDRILAGETTGLGVSTGIPDLDHDTGGFRPGELWVVAGRASMGKTIVATSFARAAARAGAGTLLFPFEIGRKQAIARILSDTAYDRARPLGYGQILKGQVNDEERWRLDDARSRLTTMPLVFDDLSRATLAQIGARVRSERDRMAKKGIRLGVVVLDYLKFIRATDRYQGQRHYEVGEITVGLKELAKDLDVCMVLLAQVNRQTESRDDKRPGLADLRESGDIETDADVVAFVYRDSYYLERSAAFLKGDPETMVRANDARHELEIIIGKNRTGATRSIKLWCDVACSKISARNFGSM